MGIPCLNGNVHLFVDLGGDGFNDMEMIFTGATLLASDILWGPAAAIVVQPVKHGRGPES